MNHKPNINACLSCKFMTTRTTGDYEVYRCTLTVWEHDLGWQRIGETTKSEFFPYSQFKIPNGCPYLLEHMVNEEA